MTDGSLKLKETDRTSRSYTEITSTFPWHQRVIAFCQWTTFSGSYVALSRSVCSINLSYSARWAARLSRLTGCNRIVCSALGGTARGVAGRDAGPGVANEPPHRRCAARRVLATSAAPRPAPSPRPFPSRRLPARRVPRSRRSPSAAGSRPVRATGTRSPAPPSRSRAPYRNGGSDPGGFDCSGFVWYVFAQHGIAVPRTVAEQFRVGTSVDPIDLQPGDLVFFNTTGRPGPSHVGISIGGDEFVHAPSRAGEVRVERLGVAATGRGVRRSATSQTIDTRLMPRGAAPFGSAAARRLGELADVQVVLGVDHRLRQWLQRLHLDHGRAAGMSPAPCSAAETRGNS